MTNISYKILGLVTGGALLLNAVAMAQTAPAALPVEPPLPKNWHQLDYKTDGYYGISLKQAYNLLKGKKSKQVIVAIIDSGVDTLQRDLTGVLWTNPKEIPGNGIDDDHDGYIDDVHGWNFLGGPNGKCDFNETTEEIREYARLKAKYDNATEATASNKKEYNYWLKVKTTRDSTVDKAQAEIKQLSPLLNVLMVTSGIIKNELKLTSDVSFTVADLDKIKSANDTVMQSKTIWTGILQEEGGDATSAKTIKDLSEYLKKLNSDINPDLDARKTIMDNDPDDNSSSKYGNNLLKFEDASHGTGVAGLIGAIRNNGYGIDGVADNVRLMPIKAVPDGDEYDKDIANAIRFAVDHGAKVINMSFGKKISPHKNWVDSAFKYAAAHNVLLVMAAGNDNQDIDAKPEFPNDQFADGSGNDAANMINVGASSAKLNEKLAATFSNYGKKNVDVFAPGVKVTSIDKDAEFDTADGTSFASPITAGIAALLLEYYPTLSARQVKQIILKSATPLTGTMVLKPGSTTEKVDFTTLSKTGGIVNAYKAVLIASQTKGELKK
ncbi:subtilase family protein [Mucilaginibacter gracilis]|uniref:Subtilase family protein n=1 Tax=Mucilaginibacter gracilis TaxID=423350 RepID=A0A495IVY0_9SPHI|nr:S8 family serine peptidase [Mucilaginibacter gracilis]RKR80643.1 subtilase family protein [Mucilaginibacter gracilis]